MKKILLGPQCTEAAFSLVEVMAGAAVLLIAILSLAQVCVTAMQLRKTTDQKLAASNAVSIELTAVESTVFDDIIPSHDGRGFEVRGTRGNTEMLTPLPGDLDGMTGQIEVTPVVDGSLLHVTARVQWQGVSGNQRLARSIRVCRKALQ